MRTTHRFAALAAATLLVLAASHPAARADEPGRSAVLRAVVVAAGTDSTRIAFETSQPVAHSLIADSASGGFRLVLRSTVLAPGVSTSRVLAADPAVRSYRIAETPSGLEVTVQTAAFGVASVSPRAAAGASSPAVVVDVPRPGYTLLAVRKARAVPPKPAPPVLEARQVDRSKAERVVVIDPGHGGDATGAIGPKRTVEKDVCLAIAQRMAERLEQQPGVRVVLTRTGDTNVALRDRYYLAERMQADAFVSIHANSGRRPNGRGTEVYFLSLESASDEASKLLAESENAADIGSVAPEEEEIVSILFDLRQQAAIRQSSELAETVLQHIVAARKLASRGVKQAPFAVLKSPIVPSILVETAFINHPEEAKLLRDSDFQSEIADQIARGVLRYLENAPVIDRASAAPAGAAPSGATGRPANARQGS